MTLKLARVYAHPSGRDPRVRRTVDFFSRKGFIANDPLPRPYREILNLDEAMWACEFALPELFEMLPVARLKFPKHLRGRPPEDLKAVLRALRAGTAHGPVFRGHGFASIARWTNFSSSDRRTSAPLTTRLVCKIPPRLARRMRMAARAAKVTVSDLVIDHFEDYLASSEAGSTVVAPTPEFS